MITFAVVRDPLDFGCEGCMVQSRVLSRGELLIEGGGVCAPEACLDPRESITRLGAKGIKAYEDLAMTRQIV